MGKERERCGKPVSRFMFVAEHRDCVRNYRDNAEQRRLGCGHVYSLPKSSYKAQYKRARPPSATRQASREQLWCPHVTLFTMKGRG